MLVTGNSTKADKPVSKSALTLQTPPPPTLHQCFILQYSKLFKAIHKEK